MLIGSKIALRGGLLAEFLGHVGAEAARVRIGDNEPFTVPKSVIGKPHKGTSSKGPSKWPIGSAVTVELPGKDDDEGNPTTVVVAGEVIIGPRLRVRVTEKHSVWFGAVVEAKDGKIRRVEG